MDIKDVDKAFLAESLPCNPRPFLLRCIELLDELGTDGCKDPRYRANLFVLMMQSNGSLFSIDSFEETRKLVRDLNL